MRIRKGKIALILACMISIGGTINADAHSGRTDSSGGHRDNKNKSGLGSYHYHCGGNPPHLHTDGCPYGKPASTVPPKNNGKSEAEKKIEAEKKAQEQKQIEEERKKAEEAKIKKEKEDINKKGHEAGVKDGYDEKENIGAKYSGNYKEEYIDGYDSGFAEGSNKLNEEIKLAEDKGFQEGIKGKFSKNEYDRESLKKAYASSYDKGFNEYMNTQIEEYRVKGETDANDKKEAEVFDNSINEKFIEAYSTSYESKKGEIEQKEKEDTQAMVAGLGLGTIAVAGGGFVIYKKKKKKKIS